MSLTPEEQRALAIECGADAYYDTGFDHFTVSVKELAAYTATVEAKRDKEVVSVFDGDYPPTFRQGYPAHELEEAVTADYCSHLVGEIVRRDSLVAELTRKLAEANGTLSRWETNKTGLYVLRADVAALLAKEREKCLTEERERFSAFAEKMRSLK